MLSFYFVFSIKLKWSLLGTKNNSLEGRSQVFISTLKGVHWYYNHRHPTFRRRLCRSNLVISFLSLSLRSVENSAHSLYILLFILHSVFIYSLSSVRVTDNKGGNLGRTIFVVRIRPHPELWRRNRQRGWPVTRELLSLVGPQETDTVPERVPVRTPPVRRTKRLLPQPWSPWSLDVRKRE